MGLSRSRHPVRRSPSLRALVLMPYLRLNFMFTISTVATNVVALPVGISLDRLGPRTTSLCGAVLFALGNFLFGYGRWDGSASVSSLKSGADTDAETWMQRSTLTSRALRRTSSRVVSSDEPCLLPAATSSWPSAGR